MVTTTQPMSATATTVLGKMLVEILSRDLTDATLKELRPLLLAHKCQCVAGCHTFSSRETCYPHNIKLARLLHAKHF